MKHIKLFENFENEDTTPVVHNIDSILDSYLEAALWTEEDELGHLYSIDDFDEKSKEESKQDVIKFMEKAGEYLNETEDEQIGHDFWLTRNHHGAGFWDREYEEEVGNKLTQFAQEFKEVFLYAENGKVFVG